MAVYTKISQFEIERLISGYAIGTLEEFVAIEAGIQNSNYFVTTSVARYVLTIYEKSLNHADLPFFLNLLGHLAGHGIPCPALITDKNGQALSSIKGKPCAITSFLKGREIKTIHPHHLADLGANIARMHIASLDFPLRRANELSVSGWRSILDKLQVRSDELEPGLTDELSKNLEILSRNWPQNLPSGVIHADIFPDNIFFVNDKLAGIIDFYFACNDMFMYDLAICLNSWCFEADYTFNATKAEALLAAYGAVRSLSPAELEALPLLAMGAAMRFLLTRLSDGLNHEEGAIVHKKDPLEYLHKLRFHAGLS